MLIRLFMIFTLIPIVELYLLMTVSDYVGGLNALLLVIVTGFLGAYFARLQGAQTMLRVKANLDQGLTPAEDMLDALLIFVAGVVLITPGLLTDIAGLLILFPATRFRFKRFLRRKFDEWMGNNTINITRYP